MGGSNWKKNYRLLSPLGRLMIFGMSAGSRAGSRSLLLLISQAMQSPRWTPLALMDKNKAVMGLNLGHLFGEADRISHGLDQIAKLLAEGAITPTVDQVFPFSKAAEAHRRIEDRGNVGKVVLVPDA
jgi:NADPH:quinone reductase-like Zn-dependent oxidoreductase